MAPAIAKPDGDRREYAFMQLDNGLRAVIGSDARCDKAGAALCVNVGMCHERKDMPGLAHFLEHMLFTGTRTYPREGEYHEFMQQNGGAANAYTACYLTNYMFEVKPEALEPALDRFSRFFVEPLLTRDCTDREINAVDSEFQGGSTQPWWRYVGIVNMSANPAHPFHVACGNVKVLRDEPKERGIDLYEEMVRLYTSSYSANGMTLCVFGRESLADLQAMVREKFSSVVDKGVSMPIGDGVSDEPPFLLRDWNRLLLMSPVKDIKELSFSWVIPYQGPFWRTKPTQYISHLLGYEGAGSVTSVLKQQGLISACYSGNGAWLEGAFSLVTVTFELTDKGLSHLTEIGEHLFAFIGMLQKVPVERWIVDEMMKLSRMRFRFAEDRGPFSLCPAIAQSLQVHPPSEALAGGALLYDYDPGAIAAVTSRLTLDSVRVCHQAKCVAERCHERDTSYGSPMAFLPLEPVWLTRWAAAAGTHGSAAALGLRLPGPNPFVPSDLSLRALPSEPLPAPMPLHGTEPMRVFHRQDSTFRQPKCHLLFQIYSPLINRDVESSVKVELWCRCVEESLSEYAYDAQVAGVSYALGLWSGALSIAFAGFSDKLSVLLQAVAQRMRSMVEVPEDIYSIVADSYADAIRNAAFHSPPYAQCSMAFNELATEGTSFPSRLRYQAFQSITRAGLRGVAESLFEECHVEAMILGNATASDARSLASELASCLHLGRPLARLPRRAEARLPAGRTLWTLDSTDADDPNNAVVLRVQLPVGVETEVMLGLLSSVLAPKFFEVLRTQQQLGYVVQLGSSTSSKFAYLVAVVQSEFPPDYVCSRIDAFFEEHLAFVEAALTEEEFLACRLGLLSELQAEPKNLAEELGRYQRAFINRSFDFERRQRAIDFLERSATLGTLRAFARQQVHEAPWLYTQLRKTVAKPDKSLPPGAMPPKEPLDLRHWSGLEAALGAFAQEAAWLPLEASVGKQDSRL